MMIANSTLHLNLSLQYPSSLMLQEDDVEGFMTIARSDYIERKQDQRLKKQIAQNERITDLSSKLDVWAGNL